MRLDRRRNGTAPAGAAAVLLLAAAGLTAEGRQPPADWPQWRGPTRDGVAPSQKWSWKWPSQGPPKLWTADAGQGYGSLIVSAGRVFAFGRLGEIREGRKVTRPRGDYVRCLDAETGKVLWTVRVGEGRGEFASATPCTDGQAVFSVTYNGNVTALDARTGREIWKVNVVRKHRTTRGGFHGIANSPLLVGRVLVLAQGVGLDKRTGQLVWQERDAMTRCHASPVPCPVAAAPGVIVFGRELMRLDPATGKVLWRQEEVRRLGSGYMDPIVVGDRVVVLSGSGVNRFRFTAGTVAADNGGLVRKGYGYCGAGDMANPVRWKGYLYAPRSADSDRSGMFADNPDLSRSRLECFEIGTMRKMWSHSGICGTPIVCDGKLIIQGQWGEIRVVEATPAGYRELANARVSAPRSGNPRNPFGRASFATPVLLSGRLYCRFHAGEVICLDLRRDAPASDRPAEGRRIVGEVCTVAGVLSAAPADGPDYVVGLLTETPPPGGGAKVYTLCARKHNDNPGAIERIAALVARKARVSVTGTLLDANRLSVNAIVPANAAPEKLG